MSNQEEYYKQAADKYMKEAFSGQVQDVQAYDMAMYYKAQYKRIRIQNLEEKRRIIWDRVYGTQAEAQDIDGMIEIEEIVEEIKNLKHPDEHLSEWFHPLDQ
jgi:hypothetical protein